MPVTLDLSRGFPDLAYAPGEVFITERGHSDRLHILVEGTIEVFRGDVSIAVVSEPGAVFGEMSILLGIPHTANVRAVTPAKVRVIDNALEHLGENPKLLMPIAQLLARRLQSSTTYLVDLKRQFQDRADHFAMVDEVLESLNHQQEAKFIAGSDLPAEP